MLTSHMTHMLQNISKLKIPTIFSHHPLQDIFKPSSPQLSRSDALVITQSRGFLSSLGAITQSVPQMIQQKLASCHLVLVVISYLSFKTSDSLEANPIGSANCCRMHRFCLGGTSSSHPPSWKHWTTPLWSTNEDPFGLGICEICRNCRLFFWVTSHISTS